MKKEQHLFVYNKSEGWISNHTKERATSFVSTCRISR